MLRTGNVSNCYTAEEPSLVLLPHRHNQREQEEAVLLAWSEYIQDRECMHVNAKAVRNLKESVNDSPLCDFPYTGQEEADAAAAPTKLFVFVTGAQLPLSMGAGSLEAGSDD